MMIRSLFASCAIVASVVFLSGSVVIGQEEGPAEPCGAECFEAARAAGEACRDEGGSFFDCMRAQMDAFRACREEAGCEDGRPGWPDRPDLPEPCGMECFSSAREASAACREEGGTFWECLGAYRDAVRACREEAGCEVRERPEICGMECIGVGRDAFLECREGDDEGDGGSFLECAQAFVAAVGACREEAGCNQADEADEEEENEVVEELILASIEFTRGDVNDDGETDITDAVNVLHFLFLSGPSPSCMDAADANDDGVVDVSDPTAILSSLFTDVGLLPEPSVEAGIDPTPDALGCGGI